MGDHDHRAALLYPDALQLVLQSYPGQRIEGAQGFVEQQHFRFVDQCAGDGCPLRHAAGQLMRVGVFKAFKVDQSNVLGHQPVFFHRRQRMIFQGQGDVLAQGHPRKQPMILKHDPALQAGGDDPFAVQQNVTLIIGLQPDDES
ncbi:hypothetical protein D3C76_1382910 [compost metagenome]